MSSIIYHHNIIPHHLHIFTYRSQCVEKQLQRLSSVSTRWHRVLLCQLFDFEIHHLRLWRHWFPRLRRTSCQPCAGDSWFGSCPCQMVSFLLSPLFAKLKPTSLPSVDALWMIVLLKKIPILSHHFPRNNNEPSQAEGHLWKTMATTGGKETQNNYRSYTSSGWKCQVRNWQLSFDIIHLQCNSWK